jgi:cell division protein FtsZ
MRDISIREEKSPIIHWDLNTEETSINKSIVEDTRTNTVDKMWMTEKKEELLSPQLFPSASLPNKKEEKDFLENNATPLTAASGGYLARPSNIYAESKAEVFTSTSSAEEPVSSYQAGEEEELLNLQMQLVERDDIPAADVPLAHQAQSPLFNPVEDLPMVDETEEQKRRAAERLQKLRNLSFNVNAADPNNEFETVPAYIRRNMELYKGNSSAENFYSNYEVKTDDNNQSHISTINTFLDGKKPD